MPKNGDKLWDIMTKIARALSLALFSIAVDTLRNMASDLNDLKSSMKAAIQQIDYHSRRLDKIDSDLHSYEIKILHWEESKNGLRK